MLCLLVSRSFADSKLLDFSDPGQQAFRINRMLGVSRYIQHRPIVIRMHESYEGGVRGRMESYYIKCSYGSSSEACVIIELAIFRGLSGDDASMSVEKSNHASSQAVSKEFIQLQIITVYHY